MQSWADTAEKEKREPLLTPIMVRMRGFPWSIPRGNVHTHTWPLSPLPLALKEEYVRESRKLARRRMRIQKFVSLLALLLIIAGAIAGVVMAIEASNQADEARRQRDKARLAEEVSGPFWHQVMKMLILMSDAPPGDRLFERDAFTLS